VRKSRTQRDEKETSEAVASELYAFKMAYDSVNPIKAGKNKALQTGTKRDFGACYRIVTTARNSSRPIILLSADLNTLPKEAAVLQFERKNPGVLHAVKQKNHPSHYSE
jgi:hypothetical protein